MPEVQPLFQHRIWARMSPARARSAAQSSPNWGVKTAASMEGGSWTNNLSWVRGYENLLGPMEEASALFDAKVTQRGQPTHERRYRNALLHLLSSQTSCYRYWGQGLWTDYARDLSAHRDPEHDFDAGSPGGGGKAATACTNRAALSAS
jgi:hypothetical protein